MKKNEIKIGKHYTIKVGNKIVPIRVKDVSSQGHYQVSIVGGDEELTLRSALRFRKPITKKQAVDMARGKVTEAQLFPPPDDGEVRQVGMDGKTYAMSSGDAEAVPVSEGEQGSDPMSAPNAGDHQVKVDMTVPSKSAPAKERQQEERMVPQSTAQSGSVEDVEESTHLGNAPVLGSLFGETFAERYGSEESGMPKPPTKTQTYDGIKKRFSEVGKYEVADAEAVPVSEGEDSPDPMPASAPAVESGEGGCTALDASATHSVAPNPEWCTDEEPDCCEGEPGELCSACGKQIPYTCAGCGKPIQVVLDDPQPTNYHLKCRPSKSVLGQKLKERIERQANEPHLIVKARAGTGKTTTLICALQVLRGQEPTDAKGRPITPSPQQKAVWDAVAQSPSNSSVCFVAFNRSIADELRRRVPPGCDAMTMHSMGLKAVMAAFPELRGKKLNEYRTQDLIEELTGRDIRELRKAQPTFVSATAKLVELCKMNLINEPDTTALSELASYYDIDMEGTNQQQVFDLVPRIMERCRDPLAGGMIDYADMIWMPVVLGLPVTKYDILFGDEVQDWNRCQQALAKMAGRRLVLCGDEKQAIYGFAGADSKSMTRMAKELSGGQCLRCGTGGVWFDSKSEEAEGHSVYCPGCRDAAQTNCIVLPLTVTRRCGKAIVAEARKIVPDFEAHESNPEGKISEARYPTAKDRQELPWEKTYCAQVREGDFILCRVNAPLVSQCFRFLRRGIKANIQGRDVGAGLINTVKRLMKSYEDDPQWGPVPALIGKLDDWRSQETAKENAKRNPSESKLIGIQDRYECLCCFCEDQTSVSGVIRKIESIFTDDKNGTGIRLSSVHKAKGLEARRVFFLMPEGCGCPHPMAKSAWQREQEMNCLYIGITRAIEELVFVY